VFVARRHELEHKVGGVLLEGQVADLVDDDQPVAAEPGELAGEPTEAVGVLETGDPVDRGGEQHPMPVMRCGHAEVGLAGAGRTEEHDVAGHGEERSRRQRGNLLADSGLVVPVEVVDVFAGREPGPTDALGTGGIASRDFAFEYGGEVVLVCPSGVAGLVGKPCSGASEKIAFARASSRFSLRNTAFCARSSSTDPGDATGRALAGADCFNQLYSVTAFIDSFGARRSHACLRDSSGPISSSTNLTAWSLNSDVYSFLAGIS